MKHTPGPWQEYAPAIPCEKASPFRVIDENYRYIRAGSGYRDSEHPDGFSLSGFISPADARLISAAPDMLEALNRMLTSFAGDLCMECGEVCGKGATCDTCYVIGKAIAAFEKATGQSVDSEAVSTSKEKDK